MDLSREYRTLRRLAASYDAMSAREQRAYDQRLGAWLLAADVTDDASLSRDIISWREGWRHERIIGLRGWCNRELVRGGRGGRGDIYYAQIRSIAA
jgi:hypothetical protein